MVYTLIYVLPFYLSAATRPSPNLSRDAPSVIKRRTQSVTVSCVVCSIVTFGVLFSVATTGTTVENGLKALHRMGYLPIGVGETIKALTLTAILFLGPLFEAGIVEGGWRRWLHLEDVYAVLWSWMGWRNFVTVCLPPTHYIYVYICICISEMLNPNRARLQKKCSSARHLFLSSFLRKHQIRPSYSSRL